MRAGRLPSPTGDVRTDAIRELRWAMSGSGLTPGKLPLMTTVLQLPAVASALRTTDEEGRPAAAYRVVVDAARELGAGAVRHRAGDARRPRHHASAP